ncbi:hypothetical protein AB0M39_19115 [Streptomyces sp. NPDC051907]|uniref:hypothetical protein n=1 Tax=Streptomyces sp. NPDC051907 TaxID=3155284 RepID=UPI003440A9AC
MTLTRGARITGAVLCAVLALITGAWIVRDLTVADGPLDLWRFWTGAGVRGMALEPLATTLVDPLLLVVCVVTAVVVLRSSIAAAVLVAAGVITLAVRLPGLWVLSSSWMDLQATDDLRTRALYCAFAALGLGVGLLIAAAAGRRPADADEPAPTRLGERVSVPAGVLLVAAAIVLTAWEIDAARQYRGRVEYADRFTGSESIRLALLGTPPGWLMASIAAIAATAGVGALTRTVSARPLGLVAGLFLTALGGANVHTAARHDLLTHLGDLPSREGLVVLSWLFELAAGATILLTLSRASPPTQETPPPPVPWSPGPPPPSTRPPGW